MFSRVASLFQWSCVGRVFLHPLRLSLNTFAGLRTTPDNLHHCTTAPKFLDRDFQTAPKFLDGWGFLFSFSLSEFLDAPEIFRLQKHKFSIKK